MVLNCFYYIYVFIITVFIFERFHQFHIILTVSAFKEQHLSPSGRLRTTERSWNRNRSGFSEQTKSQLHKQTWPLSRLFLLPVAGRRADQSPRSAAEDGGQNTEPRAPDSCGKRAQHKVRRTAGQLGAAGRDSVDVSVLGALQHHVRGQQVQTFK